jgi:carboxymethylenebutenolidase
VKPLGDFQRYLIEEFVEDWRDGEMTRRDMVRRAAYITGGVASAATVLVSLGCGPQATATAVPKPTEPAKAAATTAPTTAPAAAATKPAAATAAAAKPTAAAAAAPTGTAAAAATKPAGATPAAAGTPAGAATKPAGATPAAAGTPAAKPAGSPAPQPSPSAPRSPLTVAENDPAIDAKKVEFDGEAGKVFGYLARPKAAGSYAGLIVIHENRGLVPHIQDVTRRAAKEGYIALAVDLLSRAGGTDKVTDPAQISGALGQAKPEDFVADLSSGVKYLQAQQGVKADKIGVFGFCFGGGYTWRLALANKEIKAAVPFYGTPPPVEQIPSTNAAVFAIYAENDARINASMPQVEDALKKANKTYQMKVFPGVNHAFHNDTGANWNEPASLEAWKDAMAWLKTHLA